MSKRKLATNILRYLLGLRCNWSGCWRVGRWVYPGSSRIRDTKFVANVVVNILTWFSKYRIPSDDLSPSKVLRISNGCACISGFWSVDGTFWETWNTKGPRFWEISAKWREAISIKKTPCTNALGLWHWVASIRGDHSIKRSSTGWSRCGACSYIANSSTLLV
jgi:hypothetical protein